MQLSSAIILWWACWQEVRVSDTQMTFNVHGFQDLFWYQIILIDFTGFFFLISFLLIWFKLAQWFWRIKFLKAINVFLLFRYYLSLAWSFLWTNVNFPHPRMLYANQVWLKLDQKFLSRIFLVFIRHCIFPLFVIISDWKECGPSFEQIWFSFTQGWSVPSLVEISLFVLEEKYENVKS